MVPVLLGLALVVVGMVALPTQAKGLENLVAAESRWLRGEESCGQALATRDWVQNLEKGRLSILYKQLDHEHTCPASFGAELRSPVPLGLSLGAGAHVGIVAYALSHLQTVDSSSVSAQRAESLGVRYLLHLAAHEPTDSKAWRLRHKNDAFGLSERIGGTDYFGVGCVQEVWSGGFEALRQALLADIDSGGKTFSNPHILTAIEQTSGPLVRNPVDRGACDPTQARISERKREPGAYEATVETPFELDVVIRATAFPTWVVRVDGMPQPTSVVAPGFVSVRIPAGKHHIEAIVSWPRFYGLGLFFAGAFILSFAFFLGRRNRFSPPSRLDFHKILAKFKR
jgi:hypothetical protein